MVHDDFHAFLLGIALQFGYIEIGVGLVEIVDEFLAVSIVVFPAFVPAFHQHGVKPVFRGEVDVFFYVCRVGSVVSVGFQLRIIGLADNDVLRVGICPRGALTREVFPPYADILRRMNPRGIRQLARFVQVQDEAGSQDVAGIVAYYDGTPRRNASGLHVGFRAVAVGSEVRAEYEAFVVQIQLHGRIVHQCGFVDIDV